ncbi:MAG: saccharopine dehydrogenase NADP-binding domain-containing protein [Chromatocurvus sp.]
MPKSPKRDKPFDIILFGATSFVGRILCDYLANEHTEPNLTWAMAARSESRLTELKATLGEAAQSIPTLVADATNEADMRALCDQARLIISTVGPYALYGELLVKACAESGTDYCDLTGEPHWIRRMLDRYESAAQASGARIVHCCGFDSIPSDLGVKFLQDQAMARFGQYCHKVKMRVKASKGGASGGTIASGVNLYKEAARDAELRRELRDPYSLCPAGHGFMAQQHTVGMEYDEDFQAWAGPFIMAAINTRVVLRSNALHEPPYHPDFLYDEGMLTGDGGKGRKRARVLAAGTKLGTVVMAVAPLRWAAMKFLPGPGEGPSPRQQQEGFYDLRFHGETDSGDSLTVKVCGDRDPGYGSTSRMLSQAGISLCKEVSREQRGGGFWTPATVFDERLFKRLASYAGLSFELLE